MRLNPQHIIKIRAMLEARQASAHVGESLGIPSATDANEAAYLQGVLDTAMLFTSECGRPPGRPRGSRKRRDDVGTREQVQAAIAGMAENEGV